MNSKKQDSRRTKLAPYTDVAGLFDNHFHLYHLIERGIDPHEVLKELFARGFVGGMDAGGDLSYDADRYELLKPYAPAIRMAVGSAPPHAKEPIAPQLDMLKEHIERYDAVGVGEIGLDFYWDCGTLEQQTELLIGQFEIADASKLPVIIHTRDAEREMEAILKNNPPKCGVMHCFSGDWELAKAALDAGLYISFSGNLSFKPNTALRSVAKRVPLDRVLVETDTPFLTPPPARGHINHPGMAIWPLRTLANLHQVDEAELLERTRRQAKELFGI